jgi:cell division protein ZapA
MTQDSMPVTVQILDKEYRIACVPDEQHGLMDCARMLDQRMREVRQNGRVIGADRIAVMAALNLLYDMMQQRDRRGVDVERLAMLQERVSAATAVGADDDANAASNATARKASRG